MPSFKNWLKNSKLSPILTKNKNTFERFSEQPLCRREVENPIQNNPPELTLINRRARTSVSLLLKDWDPAKAGVTSIETIKLSSQGTIEAGLLCLQLLETTHAALTGGKAGANWITERLGFLTDSMLCEPTCFSAATSQVQTFQPLQV
jgi:hypothetical protein